MAYVKCIVARHGAQAHKIKSKLDFSVPYDGHKDNSISILLPSQEGNRHKNIRLNKYILEKQKNR